MVIAIGADIVEIARIGESVSRQGIKFAQRILSATELEVYQSKSDSVSFLAKRFAAKEAFSKALGTGISSGINFNEIIILNKKSGKPYIYLKGKTKKKIKRIFKQKKTKISLSLSDERDYAVAFVTISV